MIGPNFYASNVSEAWLKAIAHVHEHGDTYHLAVHIQDMTAEDASIRKHVNAFLDEAKFPPVATVRNTIFPKKRCPVCEGRRGNPRQPVSLWDRS